MKALKWIVGLYVAFVATFSWTLVVASFYVPFIVSKTATTFNCIILVWLVVIFFKYKEALALEREWHSIGL